MALAQLVRFSQERHQKGAGGGGGGAFGFGLKAIAKSLHAHGLIETSWTDGPSDGMGAMVGAWAAEDEAKETGVPFDRTALMREIESYNEVDCRVMMEIVRYLRERH